MNRMGIAVTRRVTFIVCILVSSGIAQTISLAGVVRDSATLAPIKGAVVTYSKYHLSDTTDEKGAFSFQPSRVKNEKIKAQDASPVSFANNRLTVFLDKSAPVCVRAFSLCGKLLASFKGDCSAGALSMPSPVFVPGVYIYLVTVGQRHFMLRTTLTDISYQRPTTMRAKADGLGKQASPAAALDTLRISGDGYYPKVVAVAPNSQDLAISLRQVALASGVRPGVWELGSSQELRAFIFVNKTGTAIDSMRFTVHMQCSAAGHDFTWRVIGPFTIPKNGFVNAGDSIKVNFIESAVTATFLMHGVVSTTAAQQCELKAPVFFNSEFYMLTVTAQNGKVVKLPDKSIYLAGEEVLLVPIPDNGYTFTGWTGISSMARGDTALVIIDGPWLVTANFTKGYVLTATATNGTLVRIPSKSAYLAGDTVRLVAQANANVCCPKWTGSALATSGDTAWVLMDGDKAVSVAFTALSVLNLTMKNGTVLRQPDQAGYEAGKTVKLVGQPAQGFCCALWSGDTSRTSGDTAWVLMNGNKAVSVDFKSILTLTVTVKNGTVLRQPDQPVYEAGKMVKLVGQPGQGYCCALWSGDTSRTSGDTAWALMDQSKSILLDFKSDFMLTVIALHGSVVRIPDRTYFSALGTDSVMLVARPESGYRFDGWIGGGVSGKSDTAWIKVNASVTVTALFSPNYGHMIYYHPCIRMMSVGFSPDGSEVAVGADDSLVILERATGKPVAIFPVGTPLIYSLKFFTGNSKIAIAYYNGVDIWEVTTRSRIRTHTFTSSEQINVLALSPDESRIATCSYEGSVNILNAGTLTALTSPPKIPGPIYDIAFSDDGSKILYVGVDSLIRLWDVQQGKILKSIRCKSLEVRGVAFTPDALAFYVAYYNGALEKFNTSTGAVTKTYTLPSLYPNCVAFSPDRTKVAAGAWGSQLRVLDLNTGTSKEFTGLQQPILSIAFSPDGTQFLTGSMDSNAVLWNADGN
jgi:WD40 repeat protein